MPRMFESDSPSFSQPVLESLLSHRLIRTVGALWGYKGKQQLYEQRKPELLQGLRYKAVIESIESSNRLEGIIASREFLSNMVLHNKRFKKGERSQGEIAGYKDVLQMIHESSSDIALSNNVVLQFHRDLMRYVTDRGGIWKSVPNRIVGRGEDGKPYDRFIPPPPEKTEERMKALQNSYMDRIDEKKIDSLILIALYVLDFLCVHPFSDGNGRMARLLTVLLLYHQGYEVGRYISLERIVEDNSKSYYDTLFESSQGWHANEHNPSSWVEYWLEVVMLGAYKELDEKLDYYENNYGFKRNEVEEALRKLPKKFTMAQIRSYCFGVGDKTISNVLAEHKKEGKVRCLGKGRHAVWEKSV